MKTKQNTKIILLLIAAVLILAACSNFLTDNPNRSPSALLSGNSFTLYPGISQTMDARQSSDPDGDDSLSYSWEVISAAGTYTLSGAATPTPTFVTDYYAAGAASYTTPAYIGSYTLRLTVTDEYGLTDTSDVAVTVANLAPTANIIRLTDPAPGTSVNLDGNTSSDPDPDKRNDLNYSWSSVIDHPIGSSWTWVPDTQTPDFTPGTAGLNGGHGVYTVRLTVTDEYGRTDTQTEIIPTSGNTEPAFGAIIVAVAPDTLLGTGTNVDPYHDNDLATPPDDNNDTFSLDASTNITNTDDDTLIYTWTFDDIDSDIDLFVEGEGSSRNLRSGDVINTNDDGVLTVAPDGAATPDGTVDFSITITVSDGAEDATAPAIWFDLY